MDAGKYGKHGFTRDNILDTINYYAKLQVLFVDENQDVILI
jgi:hypothetical protein